MIKLERPDEPQILIDNGATWLNELQDAIAKYKSYKAIPDDEKAVLVAHYRHADIKNALSSSSHGKCAFCECHPAEGGYIQVEHFKPKATYPQSTFEWTNLLPACAQCNGSKLNHDTVAEPIINPYDINPADAFYFDNISIKPQAGSKYDVAKKTIEVCSLEGTRLWKPRADILISLTGYAQALSNALEDYDEADTERKKVNRLRKISESLATIESLMDAKSKYSAFCSHFLRNCPAYIKAKQLVEAAN
jgi:uncharacterized protein (TIGR02646 family)